MLVVTASLVFVFITLDDADNDDHSKKREAVTHFEEQTVGGDMSYAGILEYKTTEHSDFVTVYDGAVTLDAEIESLIESDPLSSDILSTAVYKGYVVGSSGLKLATIQIGSEGTMVVLSQGEKIGNSEWEVIEINPQYIIFEAGEVQRKLELK
jgi:hypothetical protein